MSDFMVAFEFLTIIPLGKEKVFAPDRVKELLKLLFGGRASTGMCPWVGLHRNQRTPLGVVGECNHCCFSCPSYGRPPFRRACRYS